MKTITKTQLDKLFKKYIKSCIGLRLKQNENEYIKNNIKSLMLKDGLTIYEFNEDIFRFDSRTIKEFVQPERTYTALSLYIKDSKGMYAQFLNSLKGDE